MRVLLGSALVAILFGSWAVAGPQGEHVIRGNVKFDRAGNTTTIHASNRSIIHYSGFDIARQETVRFVQPSATSTVLNRIRSAEPTRIDGALRANGIVYLVNRAGVIFGPGSVVDVAGIYAAASSISNADFVAGINRFTDSAGSVVNYGQIVGSSVNLIGRHVANHGSIVADNGLVTLVAGKDVLLTEEVGGHVLVKLEGSAEPAGEKPGVENTGSIQAEKGSVLLGAGDMFSLAARSAGSIKAQNVTVAGQAGVTEVSGSIDASEKSPGGRGGNVKVLGEKVALKDADIDASGSAGGGEVLVGGDLQGGGDVPTAQFVFVTQGTTIRADATDAGDGGKVIVWADQVNRTHGQLSARGGSVAGDGGLIETSGKKLLVITSVPDAAAPAGRGGTWLLDPESIDITGAQANITQGGGGDPGPVTFDPTAIDTVTTIDVANINAALNAGSNVTVNTASGGTTTNGTITVTSSISKTADGGSADGSTLTLNADADIVVDGMIGSTTGVLNVDLNAGLTSGGVVDINNTITTNGGTFASSGTDFDNTGGAITTGGGIATIDHSGTVTVGANIDSGAGAMSITSGNDGSGNLSFGASVTLTSDSIALRAGNDGGSAAAAIDATTNTPTFENAAGAAAPGTFTFQQDAAITDAMLPANTQFTGGASPATYNIESDDGGVSLVVNAKIAGSAVTVTGLTGGDAYQIDAAAAGQTGSITLNAGADDDTLTIDLSAGTGLPSGGVTFNGEGGTRDALVITEGTNAWNITGGSSGTVTGVVAWNTVEELFGGSGVDTFTLGAAGTITALDGGGGNDVFNMDGGALTDIARGGAGDDTFDFANGVTIAGGIDGGAGTDTLDLADCAAARTVALTNVGATDGFDGTEASITGGFDNIDEVIGSSGATTDSLTGIDDVAAWGIDGSNDYTSGTNTLAFSNFETLTGGSNVDTFTLDTGGTITDLNGAGSDDIFNLNGGTLSGTAAGDAGDDTFTIGAGALFTGACAGGTGTYDTLVKVDGGAWGISGSGSGSVNGLDGGWTGMETLTGGTGPDTFVVGATGVITNLNGGAHNDTFDLSATTGVVNGDINGGAGNDTIDFGNGVTVGGNVDGGAGTDTLNFAAYTTGRNFTLSSAGSTDGLAGDEAAIGGTFDNIDVIVGGTVGDSLTGMAVGAGAWVIDGGTTETYTGPAGTLTFSNIESLAGGDGIDTFTLSTGGSIANFNGNAGDDIFNLNGGTMTGTMSGGLGDDTFNIGAGASFAGACDGGAGNDTLTKADGTNTWNITGAGSGTVGGLTGGWSNMETLTGGTGVDTFTLPGGGSITDLNGGGNADVFNFNGGALTGTASGDAGADLFDFADGGAIAGNLDGGADSDTLDFADYAAGQSVTLLAAGTSNGLAGSTSITGTFDNINVLVGSTAAGDSLTGLAGTASWTLDGGATESYTSGASTLTFSDFEDLTGGGGADTFTLSGTGSVADLDGAGGNDVFNIDGGTLSGTASGGAGDDIFDFAHAQTIAGSVDGGAGSDTLDFADYNISRTVTLSGTGTTDGFAGGVTGAIGGTFDNIDAVAGSASATGDSLTGINATATWAIGATNTYTSGTNSLIFSNIEDLTGNAGADTFDFAGTATVGGAIDGAGGTDTLDWADYASARAVIVTGTGTTDGFDGTEPSISDDFFNIDGVIGGSATTTDSLSGINSAATWDVDGTDQYTASGRTLNFGNMNVLNGGSNDDALTLDFSGGNPIPTGGLTFNGGGQALSDSLTLQGSSPASVTHTFDTASTGDVDVTGSDTITYTGLEPITDNLSPTDRVFTFNNNSADTIVVGDEGTADNNISEIASGVSETVTFVNPTNSLTVNTGGAGGGSDTVTVHLDTQGGAEFGGDLNIGSTEGLAIGAAGITVDATTGTVRINAGAAVTQSGTVTATALGVLANGAITLTQSNDVDTFAAESTAASAAVQLTDTGNLSIGTVADAGGFFGHDVVGIVTSDGDASVTCGGNLTLTDETNVGAASAQLETTTLDADILDDLDAGAVDVTAASLTLITNGAGGDAGEATNYLELAVNSLDASGIGGMAYTGLFIAPDPITGEVTGTYSAAGSAPITVTDPGIDVIFADGASLSSDSGTIAANIVGEITFNNATLQTTSGLIDLGCDTFTMTNGTIQSGGAGDVQITTTGAAGTGNVSLTGGTITAAGSGEILITSAGNVTDGDATARLIAPDLRIDSANGIGASAANPLNTNVTNLAVRNAGSSGIYLVDADALNIGGGGLAVAGQSVTETDTANDGFIGSGSPYAFSGTATHNGSFSYVAPGSGAAGDDLTINTGATITLNSATPSTLHFHAGDDVLINGDIRTQGAAHTVDVQADTETDGSGNVTLTNGSIAPTADTLRIDILAGGSVTDSDATIRLTATDLTIDAASGIGASAGNPLNTQVTNLAVRNTTSGGIHIENTGALDIGGGGLLIDGTNAVVDSDSAVDGFIRASTPLTISMPATHNGSFTYQAGDDDGTAGDMLTIGADVTLSSATDSTLAFVAGDDIDQTGGAVSTGGGGAHTVVMWADHESHGGDGAADGDRGHIDQTGGSLAADHLLFSAEEAVTLRQAGNDLGTISGRVNGSGQGLAYEDADDLAVSSGTMTDPDGGLPVNPDGILTSDGDVCLVTGDWLNIMNPIAVGTGTVRINSGGTVDQAATGTITADELGILSVDTVVLELGNDVNTLSAEVTTNTSGFHFSDADDLTVGAVADAAPACLGQALDGILTDDGDVCLASGDWLSITNPIQTSATAAAGTVRISSGGTLDQSGTGTITAQRLGVLSVDTVILELGNNVGTLSGRVTTAGSGIHFRDVDGLTVGAVADAVPACLGEDLDGILTNSGDVCLVIDTGALAITNPITAAAGTVRINSGGTVDQSGMGTITANELGILSVDTVILELGNDVGTLAAKVTTNGSGFHFRDGDDLTVGAVLDAVAPAETCLGENLDGILTDDGDVCLVTGDWLDVTNPIQTSATAAAGTVRINSGGTVNQSATGTITAQRLGVLSVDTVILELGNDVGTLAGRATTGGSGLHFNDVDDLTVGPVEDAVAPAEPCLGENLDGILTNDGDVCLVTGDWLNITNRIQTSATASAGVVRINSGGTVDQAGTGTITAQWLGVLAVDTVILELGNDVNTLAGKVTTNASDFHFSDADDLTVGAVSDAIAPACLGENLDGILTDDGDICLAAGDWLNITTPIQTSATAAAGTVRINSGGTLDQAGTGTITADALGVLSVDTVTLEFANNNVTTLAGEVTTAGAGFLFREADGLTIGTVADATPACLGQALPGLVTNNGIVRMRTGGAIAQTADVTAAGFGAMTAGGNVTLDRNGNAVGTYAVRTQNSTGNGGDVTLWDQDGLTIGTVTDSGGLFGGSLVGINTTSTAVGGVAGDVDLQLPGTVDGSVLLILDSILANATGAGGTAGNITMATSTSTIALEQRIGTQWYPYYRPRHVIRFGDGTAGKTILVDARGPGGNGAILVNDLTRTFPTAPLANSVPTGDEGMGMASIWGKVASNGAVYFRSGYFAMGPNEKFTSLGSIYIQTSFGNVPAATLAGLPVGAQSRDARVSDLTAASNLVVDASGGRVDLQGGRGPDNLVAANAGASYRTIVGDKDMAFLAGGQLNVFGSPLNLPVDFIAADVDGGGGAWGIQFLGADLNLLLAVPSVGIPNYDTSSPGRAALAIAAETTLPTRGGTLATALASALPEEEIEVTMESTVAGGQREDLVRHLGIFTKDPNDDELVDFLCGRRFFMDTPEFAHVNTAGRPVPDPGSTSPSQHKASIDRLPGALGREGLTSYRALYWRQKVDPKTGRKTWISLAAQIRDVLGKSVTAYKAESKGEFDPVAYRKWLSKKADQKEARELMAGLSSLFRQVELLGLGPVELANSHRMLARSIKPRGVSVEQLIDAVKASPRGKEVAATTKK